MVRHLISISLKTAATFAAVICFTFFFVAEIPASDQMGDERVVFRKFAQATSGSFDDDEEWSSAGSSNSDNSDQTNNLLRAQELLRLSFDCSSPANSLVARDSKNEMQSSEERIVLDQWKGNDSIFRVQETSFLVEYFVADNSVRQNVAVSEFETKMKSIDASKTAFTPAGMSIFCNRSSPRCFRTKLASVECKGTGKCDVPDFDEWRSSQEDAIFVKVCSQDVFNRAKAAIEVLATHRD